MECWNGSCTKSYRQSTHLCWFNKPQWEHPLPNEDHTLAQLTGATVFSILEANSGFWQIGLFARVSKTYYFYLFSWEVLHQPPTLWNKFCPWTILKAGLQVQEGTHVALCEMDGILVFGLKNMISTWKELFTSYKRVTSFSMKRIKCEFSKPWVEYLASITDCGGVRVNPERVEAIREMKTPKDQSGLRRFLGIINQ